MGFLQTAWNNIASNLSVMNGLPCWDKLVLIVYFGALFSSGSGR